MTTCGKRCCADADAAELRIDPNSRDPFLPDLQAVRQRVRTTTGIPSTLAVRDPRIRVEVVSEEGGTTLTEAAVSRGLRWLSRHQDSDGRWSLDNFDHSPGCTCTGGGLHSDSAATSLALLPYLGAGQTHLAGHYRETVSRGLRWLLAEQEDNGDLRGDSEGNSGMYAHGQGAIVLCEAFLMTGDEVFRDPAQRAIDFIVKAQHSAGGWRYSPGDRGDTSVLGWQLMALQSARAAGLRVPAETFESAAHYLDSVAHDEGARYAYQPRLNPTHVMTAEALLCRLYLGWNLRPRPDGRCRVSRARTSSQPAAARFLLLVLRLPDAAPHWRFPLGGLESAVARDPGWTAGAPRAPGWELGPGGATWIGRRSRLFHFPGRLHAGGVLPSSSYLSSTSARLTLGGGPHSTAAGRFWARLVHTPAPRGVCLL